MNPHSADPAGFDPAIDPILRDVPARASGAVDLAALFSDEAIDRLLRDVPGRMTSVRPLGGDRHRRGVVDLEAMASSFRGVPGPVVEPVAANGVGGARLAWPGGQVRRFARSAARAAREAVSVAMVLSLVVGLFSVSVMTSKWLSQPQPTLADASSGGRPGEGPPARGAGATAERSASNVATVASRRSAGLGAVVNDPAAGDGGRVAGTDPSAAVDATARPLTPGAARGPFGNGGERFVGRSDLFSRGGGGGSRGVGGGSRGVAGGRVTGAGLDGGAEGTTGGREQGGSAGVGETIELRAAPVQASGATGALRSGVFDPAEPLRVVAGRRSVARVIPYHRGYDLAFEMTRGEAPFVDPSLTPVLAVDQPPLSRRTDSFDAVLRQLAALRGSPEQGPQAVGSVALARRERLRQALAALRVEDLVAAVPAPEIASGIDGAVTGSGKRAAGGPVIRLAGSASISGRPSSRLVEVSVTAPPLPPSKRPAGEIVYVLDGSAAAGAGDAWPAICRGLDDAVHLLGPASSITVVIFADRPQVVARGIRPADFSAVRDRIGRFRLTGSGDLHGCMEVVRGLTAAGRATDGPRVDLRGADEGLSPPAARCVIVAHAGSIARAERDGDSDLAAWRRSQASDAALESVAAMKSIPVAADRVIEVVEIDAASGAIGEAVGRRGGSPVDGVGLDSTAIRRSIVEASLGGLPDGRFEGCRLEVAFDPAQVAAYRLVGHRRQVLDMAASRSSVIDLFPGECVRVIYEVVLRGVDARGEAGATNTTDVVKATCRYRSGENGPESTASAGISHSQLALDPAPEDRAGQSVWLAAAVAEQAAGSAHVDSLQRLRERIRERFDRLAGRSSGSPSGGDQEAAGSDADPLLRELRAIWAAL